MPVVATTKAGHIMEMNYFILFIYR